MIPVAGPHHETIIPITAVQSKPTPFSTVIQ